MPSLQVSSPEFGTVRKTGKSKCASRSAVATSAAISFSDCRMIPVVRRVSWVLRFGALCCPPWCGGIYRAGIADDAFVVMDGEIAERGVEARILGPLFERR